MVQILPSTEKVSIDSSVKLIVDSVRAMEVPEIGEGRSVKREVIDSVLVFKVR